MIGMSKWSLLFAHTGSERCFVESQREHLSSALLKYSIFALFVTSLLVCVTDVLPFIRAKGCDNEERCFLSWMYLTFSVLFPGQMIVACGTASALAHKRYVSTLCVEMVTVVSFSVMLLGSSLHFRHYIARAWGYDDTARFWGMDTLDGADKDLLILITILCNSLHHFIPVRWILLVPVQVISILAYVLPAIVWGASKPHGFASNVVNLFALVATTSCSKRWAEQKERMLFSTLINEKTLRFEAEFKMSQSKADGARSSEDCKKNTEDDAASQTATTRASHAFELAEDGEVPFQLLYELGQREQWLISASEVHPKPQEVLGEGGFGVVIGGRYQGTEVALKAPKLDIAADEPSALVGLCNELRILRRLRHPNIVILYGAVLSAERTKLCLVLELLSGMSLTDFVASCGRGLQLERLQVLQDIASALRFLHSRQPVVVHGDLKDTNTHVQRCGDMYRAKLLDFGLARLMTRRTKPMGGTTRWAAPELLVGDRAPNSAMDVFSFGRLVFFVTIGERPFANKHGSALRKAVRRGLDLSWPQLRSGDVGFLVKPVVDWCVSTQPALRPSVEAVSLKLGSMAEELRGGGPRSGVPSRSGPPTNPAFQGFDFAEECCGGVGPSVGPLHSVPESQVVCDSGHSSQRRSQAPTPPSPAAPSPTAGSSTTSPRGSGDGPCERLVNPNCIATPTSTIKLSVAYVMSQWNHAVRQESCCEFHAGLGFLELAHKELSASPCSMKPEMFAQCKKCHLLYMEKDQEECEFCGGDVTVVGSSKGKN